MKTILTITILFVTAFHVNSQRNVDSLRTIAFNAPSIDHRINASKLLIREYLETNADSSLFYIDYLKEIHSHTGNRKALMEHYVYLGALQKNSFQHLKSAESMITLSSMAKADSLWDYKAYAMSQLSFAFMSLNDYDNALMYADSSVLLSKEHQDDKTLSASYITLGLVYQKQGLYEEAVNYNKKSLHYRDPNTNQRAAITCYNNMGICYKLWGKLDEAVEAYDEVVRLAKEIGYSVGLFRVYNNLGNLYRENGDTDFAHYYYLKCDSIYETGQVMPLDVTEAYTSGLLWTSSRKGDLARVQKFLDVNNTLIDSVHRLQLDNTKAGLEKQISFYEREAHLLNANLDLAEENRLTEVALLQSKNNVSITIAVILGFAICVIALVLILKRQVRISKKKEVLRKEAQEALELASREKDDLEVRINQKSADLTNLALGIKNKNEILDQLLVDMENNSWDHGFNLKMNEVYRKVKEVIQLDRDRDLLELYISDIHNDFGAKIKQLSDKITDKEVKISGLIRLGMSSKEISLLLNISPGSVDTYRYNIRKKLGMGKEKSLANMLAEL